MAVAVSCFGTQQPFEPKGVCVTVLSRAGPDAGPKVSSLHAAAETNDIESACLLLKAGKDVREIKCVLLQCGMCSCWQPALQTESLSGTAADGCSTKLCN